MLKDTGVCVCVCVCVLKYTASTHIQHASPSFHPVSTQFNRGWLNKQCKTASLLVFATNEQILQILPDCFPVYLKKPLT